MERVLSGRCDSREFRQLLQWIWYEAIDPFGETRADWRAAQVTAMAHNVAVPEHQKQIEEFLLKFSKGRKRQKVTEQIMILKAMAAAYSGG